MSWVKEELATTPTHRKTKEAEQSEAELVFRYNLSSFEILNFGTNCASIARLFVCSNLRFDQMILVVPLKKYTPTTQRSYALNRFRYLSAKSL